MYSYFGYVPYVFGMDQVIPASEAASGLLLFQVSCTGNERDIKDCRHQTSDDCGRTEGLGVRCYGDGPSEGFYQEKQAVPPRPTKLLKSVGRSGAKLTADSIDTPFHYARD